MAAKDIEALSEEERRALRGSKFAPLPSLPPSSRAQPRLAHPGGPLTTNKAAALAKFLERKLQDPNGLSFIDPDILELAVENAKATVIASSSSNSRAVRHVDSFLDMEGSSGEDKIQDAKPKKLKKMKEKKKKKKKGKRLKAVEDHGAVTLNKPKKKVKL